MRTAALAVALAAAASTGCDSQSCNTVSADVGEACLPDTIAPGSESVIDVRELCGQACSLNPGCAASLVNGQVVLDFHADLCSQSVLYTCQSQLCTSRTARCRLPSLQSGDYTLVAPGGFTRILHVRPGGQSSCNLPAQARASGSTRQQG